MRKAQTLAALFSGVRRGILSAVFTQPEKWWYLSELAARLSTSPSSLQRELAGLVANGILQQRREGTRTYYRPETRSPIFNELRSLFEKTAGLVPTLKEMLEPFDASIDCAFVYGSVARARETTLSDVDLMVIGGVGLAELTPALRKAEVRLGREINVTSFSRREFRSRAANGDHFLTTVLRGPKQFVKGSRDDLGKVVGEKGRPEASHVQK